MIYCVSSLVIVLLLSFTSYLEIKYLYLLDLTLNYCKISLVICTNHKGKSAKISRMKSFSADNGLRPGGS